MGTERIHNRKRKLHNNQTCLNQKDNQNLNNLPQKKYETGNKQNYSENKQEKMKNVQNIFSNLKVKNEHSINLNENENTRSKKRKRFDDTTFVEEHDEQK